MVISSSDSAAPVDTLRTVNEWAPLTVIGFAVPRMLSVPVMSGSAEPSVIVPPLAKAIVSSSAA